MLGHFYGTYYHIIGLKAPGNCSDQFWSNKLSILLWKTPQTPNSMISEFSTRGEPLFMDLNIPELLQRT